MPVSYKDLKSKKYLGPTKSFLESQLGIRFIHSTSAHCPFHDDARDSFRLRISKQNEVRFHCFGACEKDWDIYDLIMLKEKCTFRQAQERFAKFLGIEDFEFHRGRISASYDEPDGDSKEAEEPIREVDAEELTDRHKEALMEAADFYNRLLIDRKDKFEKGWRYLNRRGIDEKIVEKFKIGFCPALEDKEYRGRAFLHSHLDKFKVDALNFQIFNRLSLFLLLNQPDSPMDQYYRKHIDYAARHAYGAYSDYFAGRITFPIFNEDGHVEGMIGRRLDNRGVRWKKQSQEDSVIKSKGWLYGIDKSARGTKEYQTAIIVEGIFDFFGVYNISENREKPIVISTLGTKIDESAVQLLKELGAKHLIIAFDWDEAGIRGIQRAATEIQGLEILFLGSLKEGEDPADRLKGVLSKVSNFGIRHLQRGMQIRHPTGKPIGASILVQRTSGKKVTTDHILLKPAAAIGDAPHASPSQEDKPRHLWYRINSIVPLLSYTHRNRVELEKTLQQIISTLSDPQKAPPPKEELNLFFRRYKSQLKEAGLLNIEMRGVTQELSVRYYTRPQAPITLTRIA